MKTHGQSGSGVGHGHGHGLRITSTSTSTCTSTSTGTGTSTCTAGGLAALLVAALLALGACGGADSGGGGVGPVDAGALDAGAGDVGGGPADDTGGGGPDLAAPDVPADTGAGLREVGAPCDHNSQCGSGFCVLGLNGYECAGSCGAGCPETYACLPVLQTQPDTLWFCVPRVSLACLPCADDSQCGGGQCVSVDGSFRCAAPCGAEGACPEEFTCETPEGGDTALCLPTSGSCDCDAARAGGERICAATNGIGTCYGTETCDPAAGGWVGCSAPAAAEEVCNGLDDDCDGTVDDGLPESRPCERTVDGVGTCAGAEVCVGAQGWVCSAPTPAEEICDYADNDCDGETDEGFQTDGVYGGWDDCGSCGVRCGDAIPNGESACDPSGAVPVCVVVACDPGYYPVSPYECVAEGDLLCQPCAADVHCAGGVCRGIVGGSFCTRACTDETPCPEGFACDDTTGEALCVPLNGSCDCRAQTAGSRRPCVAENALGTCYGVETCDPALGWTGCTAPVPADEVCNGLDDDCDGALDEGVPETQPCERDVPGVGTCTGTAVCLGSLGWVCDAADPAPESCDERDDDCDGETDEGFQVGGVYATLEHCGSCETSCVDLIPNAVEACDPAGAEGPECVAVGCEPGFVLWEGRACVLAAAPCTPCADDAACGGGRCVDLGDGSFCVAACVAGACAEGFECQSAGAAGEWCLPTGGSCSCAAAGAGAQRPCYRTNDVGTCWGAETCDPATGWQGCDAAAATAEECNGVDDDCDGLVDEDLGTGAACTNDVAGVGSCPGVEVCRGADGWVCGAATPGAEACDYADNDCDGATDEDFTAGDGSYGLPGDCGGCGNDCAGAIAHATGTCAEVSGGVYGCVVEDCDEGWVAVNPWTCVWLPDVQCAPCNADEECPGDATCEDVDGEGHCLLSCADGAACPDGASCADVGGGVEACAPDTGSCGCSAANAGATRLCAAVAAEGTCYGLETCDPGAGGWAGCDAPAPVAEECNGADDDCDGLVDEGLATAPCAQTVEGVGTCGGTQVCLGGLGWVCSAPAPEPELCDFLDNDCDGATDEDFRAADGSGAYATDEHCGTCFASCRGLETEHGTIGCVVGDTDAARCGVVACDEGYVPLNAFTCAEPVPVACLPCADDGDCLGRSCVLLGGSSFCLEGCGAGAAACPTGYVCSDVGGAPFCLPPNGTCGCTAETDGTRRPCEVANEYGTCVGFETCDQAVGWGACTAAVPAPEVCNGRDDDCSGAADDLDSGGLCERTNAFGTCPGVEVCRGAAGWTCGAPEPAAERCDDVDNDCDGESDEPGGLGCLAYYEDDDEDGAGVDGTDLCLCEPEGLHTALVGGDCDDGDPTVSPIVTEACNAVDDDCDGATDEAGAAGCQAWHADRDSDGWGSDADVRCLCAAEAPYTLEAGGDCDDDAPATNPAGAEVCGGADEDCDGEVDEEGTPGCVDWFRDADGDGYGNAEDAHCLCAPRPPYTGTVGGDCSDQTAAISPAAPEVCNDFDDDCDGVTDEEGATGCAPWYVDGDDDGFGADGSGRCLCGPDGAHVTRTDSDCDDTTPAVNPARVEICNGAVDDDCDGETDEVLNEDPALTGCTTFHRDDDEDGYGVAGDTACTCGATGPTPYTAANGDDCDDAVATTFPAASEACNGVDDDCDGTTDVGELADFQGAGFPVDYGDEDGDGVANCVDPCPVYVDQSPAELTDGAAGTIGNPWPTIQAGIDAAGTCDQVWVHPGTYVETVRFNGHHLRLESVAGPAETTIDGDGAGATVTFDQGEQPPAALVGFTVTGGTGNLIYSSWKEVLATPADDHSGGGVFVQAASPLIQGNVITGNDVPDQGGGILLYASYAHVVDNEISYNTADDAHDCGGGILSTNSQALIERNYVHHNECLAYSGDGGGLMEYASSDHVRGNIFTANRANRSSEANGAGVRLSYYGEVLFEGNLIYGNLGQGLMVSHGTTGRAINNTIIANTTYGLYVFISSGSVYSAPLLANNIIAWNDGCGVSDNSDSPFTYSHNDVYGNGTNYCDNLGGASNPTGTDGNISQNPQFTTWSDDGNFANDDFSLQPSSPCHDAGADLSAYGITTDYEGAPRPRGAAYDMGAYEVQE